MKKLNRDKNVHQIDISPIKGLLRYRWLFFASLVLSVIFYSVFITQQLTNTYDGIWLGDYLSAGAWEVSIGRWMLIYLDRLHLGMQTEPLATGLTLAFILAGAILMIDMFRIRGIFAGLVPAAVMTGSIVTCIVSYRYTAISYGICMFLSVASVWFLMARPLGWLRYVLSCGCLVCSLGIYQSDIAVTAVLMVFIFIEMLLSERDAREIRSFVIESAAIIILGCIIYRIIAVLHMQLLAIPPADYMGADSLSIGNMILALPESIGECYQHFYRFFFTDGLYYFNIFQRFIIFRYLFAGFMLLMVAVRLAGILRRKHFVSAGLVAAAILVLPIACDLSMLFAPEAGYMMQQTFGLFMVFPCVLCLIRAGREDGYAEAVEASDHEISDRSGKGGASAEASSANVNDFRFLAGLKNGAHSMKRSVAAGAFALLAMFFIYGNAWQCNRDIMAMDEGRTATRAMLERMVDDLIQDGLLSRDRQYAIMGRPADNKTLFVTSGCFDGANGYARYGEFWTDTNSVFMYYQGLLRDISVNMPLVNNETYEALRNTQEVKSMPAFPAEGSIREINGVVVVKLG